MKVWEVGVSDCESSSTICICTTKEIALREMFKKRDELITQWRESDIRSDKSRKEYAKTHNIPYFRDDMYLRMIKALSHNHYETWDNYPHEVPWIYETNLIDS